MKMMDEYVRSVCWINKDKRIEKIYQILITCFEPRAPQCSMLTYRSNIQLSCNCRHSTQGTWKGGKKSIENYCGRHAEAKVTTRSSHAGKQDMMSLEMTCHAPIWASCRRYMQSSSRTISKARQSPYQTKISRNLPSRVRQI